MNAMATDRHQLALRIVECAPVLILILDLEGSIQHINAFFEQLTGFRLEQVRGRTWFDTFLPERDRERIRTLFGKSRAGEHMRSHVNPIVTRTGEERQIEWTDEFLRDEEGAVTGILAIGQDVTERLAEEVRFRSVIEAMHDGVVVQSADGAIVSANPAAERMLGLSVEQMAGRSAKDPHWHAVHEDGTPFPAEDHPGTTAMRTGTAVNDVVMGVHRPGGHLVWLLINAVPFLRPGDNAVLGNVTSFSDITALRKTEAKLRERDLLLARAQETAHLGTFQFDPITQVVESSDELFRIFGVSREEFRFSDFRESVHPDQRALVESTIQATLESRQSYDIVHALLLRDGTLKHVRAIGETVVNADGRLLLVGTVQDITERTQAEQLARNERERLREAQVIAKLGNWELDLAADTLIWSDEIFSIFEIDPTRFGASYEAFLAAIHPDDRASVDAAYQASVANGTSYEIVHRLLLPDARIKWVRERGQTRYSNDGHALRSVGTVHDISSQVQSELRMRNILDGMLAFVGLYDLEGALLEANRSLLEMTGLRREDVIGKPFWETYLWAYAKEAQDQVRAALARAAGGDVVRGDFVVRIGEGRFITVDAVFSPLRDGSGRIDGVVGSGIDITDRKNAEDAARRSADLLRTVITGAPIVMFAIDPQGMFRFSEGRGLEKLGLAPGQMVGVSALEAFDGVPGFKETFRRALAGEQATLAANIGPISFEAVYAPSYDVRGEVDGVIGVGFDVTDRVKSELALRERETRLSAVFDHTSDAMTLFALDAAGTLRLVAANRASIARLRRAKDIAEADLLGLSFEVIALEIYRRPPEALAQYQESFRRVIDTRTAFAFEDTVGVRDGTIVAEVTLVPILDETGACVQVLWSSHDITTRKRADAQVRSALREKETLLREIHHRVKNNLQVVAGLLHFQAKKLRVPEDAAAFAELRQRIFGMTLLHERLYQAPDVANVVFCDYVRDLVAELARSFAPRSGIRIVVTTSDDVRLPIELAMPSGMIVSELVINVLKYAFPGTRDGTVTVSVRMVDDRVVLGVDDDGVGFPDGFDPDAGSSFGWELVRTLVMQLDGAVEATTDQGAHVRVSFAMPALAEGPRA